MPLRVSYKDVDWLCGVNIILMLLPAVQSLWLLDTEAGSAGF